MAKEKVKPAFDVLAPDSNRNDPRDVRWTRIGVAFPSKDGAGFNIVLNAHPIGNSVILRVPLEKDQPTQEPMNDDIKY